MASPELLEPALLPVRVRRDVSSLHPGGTAPPIRRGSMVPVPWHGFLRGLGAALRGSRATAGVGSPPAADLSAAEPWEAAAKRRRRCLLALIGVSSACAAVLFSQARPAGVSPVLAALQLGFFTLLFAWVSAGFFTALMGFFVELKGDRFALKAERLARRPIDAAASTAVIMPICNEHVPTVFAGLRATCESLAATGWSGLFDIYVLSDSNDPQVQAAELAAWSELQAMLAGRLRVHYRLRRRRVHRKAGNVADFCRRWGRKHRYMVVLDADSVMSGDCVVSLVRLMEDAPRAGIIQTAPRPCGLSTLHARAQQFASRVTGRLFSVGMQYWQLGESHYWGHNAIIRVEPFMRHCALAALPGKGGLSGDILSHDFVEAALMRRAGYQVWLAADLDGSHEQQPPHLLAELQRDRRWCQGNLQNSRLIAEPGLHGVHRAMLATGAMAYLSAPLWLAFMSVGAALWLLGDSPAYGLATSEAPSAALLALWSLTLTLLALPRLLGIAAVILKGEQSLYGGSLALCRSAAAEAVLSVLQAPVRMVWHTVFVVVALTGLKLDWKSPPREAAALAWGETARQLAPAGVIALLLGVMIWFDDTSALLGWVPVGLPLVLALPLAVLTSHVGVGERWRARGLLAIPEETATPRVLRRAWRLATLASAAAIDGAALPAPGNTARSARTAGAIAGPGMSREPAWQD